MSTPYSIAPQTHGKVVLVTTMGEIEIELWSKQTPKTCRNFVQLCVEGYYDNTIFHRIIKDFMVQGGDPTGSGTGGESIYGEPFKDELHSRLKFSHRGIVAMASSGKNQNESQFFITFSAQEHLNKKHTIFGKVAGDTIFNFLKMNELELEDSRPKYPPKILRTEVLMNPFDDITPRKKAEPQKKKKKNKRKKYEKLDTKVLSFGDDAENTEYGVELVKKRKRNYSRVNDSDNEDAVEGDVEMDHVSKTSSLPLRQAVQTIADKLKKERIIVNDVTKFGDEEESAEQFDERMKKIVTGKLGLSVIDKNDGVTKRDPDVNRNIRNVEDNEERLAAVRKERNKLKKELQEMKRKKQRKEEMPTEVKLTRLQLRQQGYKKRENWKRREVEENTLAVLEEFKSEFHEKTPHTPNEPHATGGDSDGYDPNWMRAGELMFAKRPQDFDLDEL